MFNKNTSKIAITVPQFTLLKKQAEPFEGGYNEPYIVSLAIDGHDTKLPTISFNLMPFPRVKAGDTIKMLGDGHLLYGPAQPGEFVALSVLVMESDSDIRKAGTLIQSFVSGKAVDLGLAAIIAANPGAGSVIAILRVLMETLATMLKNNSDDELYRVEGVFLQNSDVPYDINREFTSNNDYIGLTVRVIPLEEANGQGKPITPLSLTCPKIEKNYKV